MLIPLGQIVRDKLIEEGRGTLHKFQRNLALGIRAVRQLNIDVKGQVKTVFLTPTNYNTLQVPNDFYAYSKVGVCENGMIYNLSVNPSLCFPHMKDACGNLLPENFGCFNGEFTDYTLLANTGGMGWWYYNWWNENGEFTGKLYGVGQGWSPFGQFAFNEENREFVVTPNLHGKKVCLEYTTTGINNAQVLVPEEAIEYVISFILWHSSKGNERQQYKAEHHLSESKLRIDTYSFTLDEMSDAIRHSQVLSPKG